MKKFLIFSVAVMILGGCVGNQSKSENTDVDSTVVDSTVVDSIALDSVCMD